MSDACRRHRRSSRPRPRKSKIRRMNNADHGELDAVCGNCNNSFPAEEGGSIFGICLKDPEFDPYIARLFANDFACCANLIERKRFMLDRKACADFDPVEDVGDEAEASQKLTADIKDLVAKGQLTPENVRTAIAVEAFTSTDWSQMSAHQYVQRLQAATTIQSRDDALSGLGFLVSQGNRPAFDALCAFLRKLPPPQTPEACRFRSEVLRHLRLANKRQREVAQLLVEDLFRTPSNRHTRPWYTEVFGFFKRCSPDVAEETLQPMLDSPKFSYRIKRQVKDIIGVSGKPASISGRSFSSTRAYTAQSQM